MRETVNAPYNVDSDRVSKDGGNQEGIEPRLIPEIDGDNCRQHEAQNWHHLQVMPVKE